jgi:hypothetical protein
MQNAARILTLGLSVAALAACQKAQTNEAAANSNMAVEGNLSSEEIPSNAQIETLPPDESSITSSGELNSGDDNPDVNDVGNSH